MEGIPQNRSPAWLDQIYRSLSKWTIVYLLPIPRGWLWSIRDIKDIKDTIISEVHRGGDSRESPPRVTLASTSSNPPKSEHPETVSVTQILRDCLYYKLSNWKDAKQWGWFFPIHLLHFQLKGMWPPEGKPQGSISWCPAALSPVTWYLCALWVGLTQELTTMYVIILAGKKKITFQIPTWLSPKQTSEIQPARE